MKTILLVGSVPMFLTGVQNVICNANLPFLVRKLCVKELESCQILRNQDAHYLLLDLSTEQKMPINIRQILSTTNFEKIMIFGSWEKPKVIKCLFKLGVNAYLRHTVPESDILEALKQIETQDHFLTEDLKKSLTDQSLGLTPINLRSLSITPREQEVLNLIVDEYTTREIAEKLFISSCTAETHRLNLINKFGVKNTAGLVREAVRTDLINV